MVQFYIKLFMKTVFTYLYLERHFLLCAVIHLCHRFRKLLIHSVSLNISLWVLSSFDNLKNRYGISLHMNIYLSLGIFCVKCNSIPPFLISAKVLLNMMKAEIMFSRNPYACVSKWKFFMTNTENCLWEKCNSWNENEIQQTNCSVPVSSQPSLSISEGAYALRGNFSSSLARTLIIL